MCSCFNNNSLFTYADCPEFLTGNQYVTNGYRICLTHRQCFMTIFKCSNEFINIWSHLLGGMLFIYCLYDINFHVLIKFKEGFGEDNVVTSLGCLCFVVCMFCSASYHIFNCTTKVNFDWWLKIDLLGISLSLWGCYIPAIYYGFYCFRIWRIFYTGSVILLMFVNIIFQLSSKNASKKRNYKSIVFFCLVTIFGVLPAIHWVILLGGFSNPFVKLFLPKIVTMYCLGIIALLFYLTNFPERIFPGLFNYIGSSHQCWHVMIVYALYFWYTSLIELLEKRLGEDSCTFEINL